MNPIEIVLPFLPPSKNEWSGRHWACRHAQGQSLKWQIFAALHLAYPAAYRQFTVPVIVAVEFRLPDNRRRDVQNLLHPGLFDALKTLTVIVDDSAQWMSLEVSSVVDGTRRTVIRIREREEENKPGRKGGQA
jgi:Holliday junction resolvase RusA-like endonuclease